VHEKRILAIGDGEPENEVLRRCLSLPACKSSGWHVARLLGHVGELEVATAAPLMRCESSGRHVARLLVLRHAGELEVAAAAPMTQ
jgi:hypothetical protein